MTRGAKLLRAWLSGDGRAAYGRKTRAVLAARLGVTRQALTHWVNGTSRPTALSRELLERITGIPRASWCTAREVRLTESAAA